MLSSAETIIRIEAFADQIAIDTLLKKQSLQRAKLVRELRKTGNNTLSLVACDETGGVFGHLLFSPALIDSQDKGVQVISNFSIDKEYQEEDIKPLLIKEGVETLYELGYCACIALENPKFYQQYGFCVTKDLQLSNLALPVLLKTLNVDSIKQVGTQISFCDAFAQHLAQRS